jgi:hypothetical protein
MEVLLPAGKGLGKLLSTVKMAGTESSYARVLTPKSSKKSKKIRCSPPVLAHQLDPNQIEWSNNTSGFRDLYASTKPLLPHIFDAANKKGGPTFAFAKTAI